MISKRVKQNELNESTLVLILGPDHFFNELMAHALESKLSLKCHQEVDCDISSIEDNGSNILNCLILKDRRLCNLNSPQSDLGLFTSISSFKPFLAYFGISSDDKISQQAIQYGLRGVFFREDSLSTFLKGVPAILSGELWFPREVLTKMILAGNEPKAEELQMLTPREVEVLSLLAVGASNLEIAKELYISPHTVKNHITRIYNKINISNRFQAALWASKNLS